MNLKMDFGCVSYCQFADQCLGDLPPEVLGEKRDLLKDHAAIDMKLFFNYDFRQIGHPTKVARYAGKNVKPREDVATVLAGFYLHHIEIHEAARKHNSTEAHEDEGSPIARQILVRVTVPQEVIGEVRDIIAHDYHRRQGATVNFKAVHGADAITDVEERERKKASDTGSLEALIDRALLTDTGRELPRIALLNDFSGRTQTEKRRTR